MDPDILIVDEALSVGDARFQAKCIRRMEEIAKNGVTVVFVSHDMQSIKKFCERVIWMDNGQVMQNGEPGKILEDYMSFMNYGMETARNDQPDTPEASGPEEKQNALKLIDVTACDSFGEKKAVIEGVLFLDEQGRASGYLKQGTWATVLCDFYTTVDLYDVAVGVLFKDNLNNEILTFNSYMYNCPLKEVKGNTRMRVAIEFKVPKIFPKEYVVTMALSEGTQLNHTQQHWIHEATTINILSSNDIDGCILTLYPGEIRYTHEQI